MRKLDLSFNKFGNPGAVSLASCIHNIDRLILLSCDVTENGVEKLCQAIRQRNFNVSCSFHYDFGYELWSLRLV